jgi:hypothetical protein
LENGRNVEALTGWAEALALSNEAELEGRAGQLFERALALEPTSPKALFFGAVAAQRRGELPLALQRFETMLAGGPPENVRPLLEQQVAMLKAAMAGAAPAAPGASPGATAGSPAIRVQVRVAPAIASRVPAGAPLFVFVRVPGQPGPPLAVKRLAATLPQLVELTPADAMMGGNGFAAGDEVEVTARVALGGQPTASTGDPFGLVSYDVGRDGEKELVIDRLTPCARRRCAPQLLPPPRRRGCAGWSPRARGAPCSRQPAHISRCSPAITCCAASARRSRSRSAASTSARCSTSPSRSCWRCCRCTGSWSRGCRAGACSRRSTPP